MTIFALALALTLPGRADLVAEVRTAVGYDSPLTQDLLLTGHGKRMGVDGPLWVQIGTGGKFAYQYDSALGSTVGYNGDRLWEADHTGATRWLAFGDEDREKSAAAIITGEWLDPSCHAAIKATSTNSFTVTMPGSQIEQAVTVDPQTHLPSKSTSESEAGKVEIDLSGWQSAGPIKVPFHVEMHEGGATDTMDFNKATAAPNASDPYVMPTWTATDTSFDVSIPAGVETRRLASGHLIVHPKVDGKDLGWFIFDSGAEAMCIDKTAADKLKLPAFGQVPAVGVGGIILEPFRSAKSFQLGPAKISNVSFVELDLAEIGKILHIELAGIIGYDVFRRCVVQMDLKTPQISIFDPKGFQLKAGAWQPIQFDGGNIAVEAKFDNKSGWFRFDTGAGGTVSFHSPFVDKYKLLDGRATQTAIDGGVGGMIETKIGKIDSFELAGHTFEKPTVAFSVTKVGALANRWLVGNIGQGFMDPFTMVFDYPNSRIALAAR